MADAQPLLEGLERAGIRVTEPRRAVAALIADREGHFTAADLVEQSRQRRLAIGRATIFRALELFVELHLVERLDLPSGEHAYVPCEPAHHHHVVCSHCGRSVEIEDFGMSDVTREVARRTGFRIERHRLEMFGICPECRAAVARG